MAEKIEITALHSFYRSLSELVGTEAMLEVYRHYRGIQVSIPVHLYDRNLAAQRVLTEFTGTNQQALARKYGYSEKCGSESCYTENQLTHRPQTTAHL
ncbi:hypothetical protein IMAU80009_03385 [Lactiplantibacillus plantarum]|nr:hypothetical protein [Lactiplantibacillus plantarum]